MRYVAQNNSELFGDRNAEIATDDHIFGPQETGKKLRRIALISVHGDPLNPLGEKRSGGQNKSVLEHATMLSEMDYHVDVFTRLDNPTKEPCVKVNENFRVFRIKSGKQSYQEPIQIYQEISEFIDKMRSHFAHTNYDIIHSYYWLSGVVAYTLKKDYNIPYVHKFCSIGAYKHEAVKIDEREKTVRLPEEKRILFSSDRIIAMTQMEIEIFRKYYSFERDNISVVPDGVRLDHFHKIPMYEARRKLRIDRKHVIIFVGRPDPNKGIEMLFKIIPILINKYKLRKFLFIIVGGNNKEINNILGHAASNNLFDYFNPFHYVYFYGMVNNCNLNIYYSAADLCVIPSLYETFGYIAIEAMACGTPIVASDTGGLRHIIENGRNGFLVNKNSANEFANKIYLLTTYPHLKEKFGENGRKRAEEQYDQQSVTKKIIAIYSSICKSKVMEEML